MDFTPQNFTKYNFIPAAENTLIQIMGYFKSRGETNSPSIELLELILAKTTVSVTYFNQFQDYLIGTDNASTMELRGICAEVGYLFLDETLSMPNRLNVNNAINGIDSGKHQKPYFVDSVKITSKVHDALKKSNRIILSGESFTNFVYLIDHDSLTPNDWVLLIDPEDLQNPGIRLNALTEMHEQGQLQFFVECPLIVI